MYRTVLKTGALAAFMACSALVSMPAFAAKTELVLGAAAADVGKLDPHFANSTSDRTLVAWIFGGLVRFAPGSTDPSTIEPDLAEKWEHSADKMEWTFHLRKGVQFQQGYGEVTADDVVFSLNKAGKPETSAFATDYAALKSVEAVDPYTVKITLAKAVPSLLGLVSNYSGGFILSKKAYEERGDEFQRRPVGFGPFSLEKIEPSVSIEFKAHDGYFRGKPKLEKIIYRFLNAASARDLAFISGEIDVSAGTTDQKWLARTREVPESVVDIFDPAELTLLHVNRTKKPFDDIRVRQALAYAVNAAQMAQFRGKEFTREVKSVIPSNNLGYTDEAGVVSNDTEKAKALLAEAGYPDGVTIKMLSSQLPSLEQSAQMLQAQVAKAGIKLELEPVEHATWHQMIRKDLSPIVMYGAARFPVADYYLTQFYHSDSIVGKPTAVTNFSHCAAADEQIVAARSEVDPDKQLQLWHEAQKLIVADVCAIPLNETAQVWVRKKSLDWGFELKGSLSLGPLVTEQTHFTD
ncbi:ABC transporter substrate-binding protein [Pseudochrobactrum sp. B5]|uniref:ABC transporter substrate-binding protein n=1 Tax=Pseudochrobactrum sp. B5 TaxID=1289478 RepID=UPI0009532207|nr:ABC transporter substrate-binding protein [Pseudochrobactrum sp. B5]